jgi:prepilin-type processing-associated H-X9-DG protein
MSTNKPLAASACDNASFWYTNANSKWADGEVYCTLYDHGYTPNSAKWDCVFADYLSTQGYSWRAARSKHPGGVNLLLVDGSARFVSDSVNPATWRALGSRNGGEVVGDY